MWRSCGFRGWEEVRVGSAGGAGACPYRTFSLLGRASSRVGIAGQRFSATKSMFVTGHAIGSSASPTRRARRTLPSKRFWTIQGFAKAPDPGATCSSARSPVRAGTAPGCPPRSSSKRSRRSARCGRHHRRGRRTRSARAGRRTPRWRPRAGARAGGSAACRRGSLTRSPREGFRWGRGVFRFGSTTSTARVGGSSADGDGPEGAGASASPRRTGGLRPAHPISGSRIVSASSQPRASGGQAWGWSL